MAFDENGNYVLGGDDVQSPYVPQGGYGSQRISAGRSFLNYFNPMQGNGQPSLGSNRKKSVLGALSGLQGSGGVAGGIGKVAGFLL